jgi:hypothetical protein
LWEKKLPKWSANSSRFVGAGVDVRICANVRLMQNLHAIGIWDTAHRIFCCATSFGRFKTNFLGKQQFFFLLSEIGYSDQ